MSDTGDLRFVIPVSDWQDHLARAVRYTPRFSPVTIVVASDEMRELGERAARRMGRANLTFETAGERGLPGGS